MNTISSNVLTETAKFKDDLVNFKRDERKIDPKSDTEMFDCTDKDDLGMTSFLAHTIDNSDVSSLTLLHIFIFYLKKFYFIFKASSANRCTEQNLGLENNLILFNSITAFLVFKFIEIKVIFRILFYLNIFLFE